VKVDAGHGRLLVQKRNPGGALPVAGGASDAATGLAGAWTIGAFSAASMAALGALRGAALCGAGLRQLAGNWLVYG
jgi:hypothetical protein